MASTLTPEQHLPPPEVYSLASEGRVYGVLRCSPRSFGIAP